MLNMLYAQVAAFFVVAICIFALVKGDDTERYGAGAYILLWFTTILVQSDIDPRHANLLSLALDVVFLLILCALSWRYRRSWPIWAAGLQTLSVMSHLFVLLAFSKKVASLYTVINLCGYGVLVCIAVGTFWAWQDRRAAGLE